jgi:hypothetical protein
MARKVPTEGEDILAFPKNIVVDPIGPWRQIGIRDELIDLAQATRLTITQVGLQKEAIALAHQALELQDRALDAIAESVRPTG